MHASVIFAFSVISTKCTIYTNICRANTTTIYCAICVQKQKRKAELLTPPFTHQYLDVIFGFDPNFSKQIFLLRFLAPLELVCQ